MVFEHGAWPATRVGADPTAPRMTTSHDTESARAATRAVEQVLRAERDADAEVGRAREQAQAMLEAAREAGLAVVNRSLERVARRQQAYAQALEHRLQRLRAQAAADAGTQRAPDDDAIAAAVERVAEMLTGGAHDGPR
jgi:vacuolar-type H+-ATPase subunit H